MVKSPKIRHSKPVGEPLTIDLSGDDVKRVGPAPGDKPDMAGESASSTPKAATAASTGPSIKAAAAPSSNTTQGATTAPSKPADTATVKPAEAPKPASSSFGRDAGKGPATPPRAPETATKSEPRRYGSPILAGLIGGVLALGGAGAAWYGGLIQPPAAPAQPAPPPATDDAAVEGLRVEIESLRAALDELRAAPAPAPAAAPDLTDVNARIESLAVLVEDLRAQLATAGEGGGAPVDTTAVDALREALAALEARVAALPAGGEVDVAPLREDIAAAAALARQASEAATQASSAAQVLGPRIDKIEAEIAGLATQVAEAAQQPGVALAIAASALKAAVDRGTPFTTELDTYASLAPDAPEVAALRPYAEKGVPTATAIEAGFDVAASAMISAGRSEDPEAGFLDKLWGSALSVVEVRPIGEVEGSDVPAIVARMEVALRRGEYARAVTEFETLPEAAKNAGSAFMDGVRARQAADDLVGKMLAAALRA